MTYPSPHVSVLLDAVLELLNIQPGAVIVDATVGAAGHAAAMLEAAAPTGRLLGIDQDLSALEIARERLAGYGNRAVLVHARFDTLAAQAAAAGLHTADAILMDLGVSSMHLDDPTRGFSFMHDGPLDMRMNFTSSGPTAADLVNTLDEDELADLIWKYGEERDRRRIARRLVAARPFCRTTELAKAIGMQRKPGEKIHPATRTFQALRIAVNDELGALERALPQAVELLKPGGRLAVISFHSLEDRIVKHFFRRESADCICPPEQPVCTCEHRATLRLLTRKPVEAGAAEVAVNPRSRSARLRVAERLV